ncbi:hypothetical protein QEN19_000935 [Hanseniaspora menglaensis]
MNNNNNTSIQSRGKRSAFANVTEAVVNGRMSVSENSLKNLKQYNNVASKIPTEQHANLNIKKRILNQSKKDKENNSNAITEHPDKHIQSSNEYNNNLPYSGTKIDNNNETEHEDIDLLSSTKKTNLSQVYHNNYEVDERGVHKRPISTFISHFDLKKVKITNEEQQQDDENYDKKDLKQEENKQKENYQKQIETPKEILEINTKTDAKYSENEAKDEFDLRNDIKGEQILPVNHYENMITISGTTTDNVKYRYEDLDLEDSDDVLMVSEYVSDIFSYFYKSELLCLAAPEEMLKHPNINQNRDILVNWLVKIHNQFNLLPETLYLAVNVMDRFLCKELVSLDKLQLVGTAALFISSKYEEVYSPSCKNFASVTDGACTEEDIKQGEIFILQTLDFKLDYPNPLNFLRRISKADEYHMDCRTVAKYLLEITIVDFRFAGIPPSKCAAAAFFLAKKMMGRPYWDGNFIHYSGGYSKQQLESCVKMMMEYLEQPVIHEEFYKKYSTRRFCKASVASRDWAKRVIEQGFDVMDLHESIN